MPFFAKSTNFWKNPSKGWQNLNETAKTGILYKKVIDKKMANLGNKGKFRQKNGEYAKIHQEFGQIFKSDDKTWHVDSWRFLGK